MALLNEADALYLGSTEVRRVFVDDEVPWVKAGLPSQSIFGSEEPVGSELDAGNDYTFGTVFRVTVPGTITHVRVYRAPGATLPNCPIAIYADFNPASVAYVPGGMFYGPGWNNIALTTPLAVVPGVDYMAAFFTAQGAYVYTSHRFDSAVSSGNLIAPGSASVGGNGRFKIYWDFSLPETSFNATWYGVDVAFVPGGTLPPVSEPTTHLVTSYTPGSDRNDVDGEVGVRIGIGGAPVTVSWMGMRVNTGNTGTRTLKLYEWFADSLQRTATVDLTGKTAGQWAWKEISPLTLTAGGYYALMLSVTPGMQNWVNPGPVAMAASITNIYDVYRIGAGSMATGLPNSSFVGLDLGN